MPSYTKKKDAVHPLAKQPIDLSEGSIRKFRPSTDVAKFPNCGTKQMGHYSVLHCGGQRAFDLCQRN